jgi:hypothetical protein
MPASRNGLRYLYLSGMAIGGAEGDRLSHSEPELLDGFPGLYLAGGSVDAEAVPA